MDSTSALFWGGERRGSGELLKDNSSSADGSLWSGRASSFPLFVWVRVHVGQLLVGFRPGWSPSRSVSVCSPAISGLHARVIRPSVWPAPLASPPSPDASGETDLQWVGSLGC